jgi:glycolate oxidase FAD binding subunit
VAWRAEIGMERVIVAMPNVPDDVTVHEVARSDRGVAAAVSPTSTADVRDLVRAAADRRTPLRLVGRGTWLVAGRPVLATDPLHVAGLTGIVEYTPGDLTLTARAGTTLSEIRDATAANGQWLALVPWGGDEGSLGATVATATAGPVAGSLGAPRDVVIGLEVVTGVGDVIRGGGRVVKNVAGFDLARLMVGAWGTLGVITEVSVRLRALPERDATLALPVPAATASLADLLATLRGAPVAPLALELVSSGLARRLALGSAAVLLVRVAGNAEHVDAQREALTHIADVTDVAADVWNALRTIEPTDATVVRVSGPSARFAETWAGAERVAAAAEGFAHASVLRSVARVYVPHVNGALADSAVGALRSESRDTRIFERLPAALWPTLAPTAVSDRLSRGVRSAFDPYRVLNPGILGEPPA